LDILSVNIGSDWNFDDFSAKKIVTAMIFYIYKNICIFGKVEQPISHPVLNYKFVKVEWI
jgi:hypothetical protein